MPFVKKIAFAFLFLGCFSCKKEVKTEIKEAPPYAGAGTNQSDVSEFQVTLNADSLKSGQSGKWTISKGLVESKVFFADDTKPDTKFSGMPGETYDLKWTVQVNGNKYSESSVKITFKALKATITNTSPDNKTQFYLTANNYDSGEWSIDNKYARINSQIFGGIYIPDINSPSIKFQGYANTNYKITWTTHYGSKSASTTLDLKTGNYLETEALRDLQLDESSYRIKYENNHIVNLDLSSLGITWILQDTVQFPAMQALTYLKQLDLNGSAIINTFPKIISDKYLQLEYLNLSNTKLIMLSDNIGNLTKLKKFVASYTGNINYLPESIGNLENLEYFEMQSAGLTYIPESFSNLKNLIHFDCSLNNIQKLPNDLGKLTKLEELRIYTQQNIPASISKLTKLKVLFFSTGASDAQFPDDLGNLISLTDMTLSGPFKKLPSTFGNLPLKNLYMTTPQLASLPDNFGNLKNLEGLQATGVFKTLPASFSNLTNLKYFTATGSIEYLPDDFGKLKNLIEVDIRFASLKALPSTIGQLVNLTKLVLDNDQIQTLPASLFDLPKITMLGLGGNKLTSLPDDFGKLSKTLLTLNLSGVSYPAADALRLKQLLPNTTIYINNTF